MIVIGHDAVGSLPMHECCTCTIVGQSMSESCRSLHTLAQVREEVETDSETWTGHSFLSLYVIGVISVGLEIHVS